MFPKYKRGIFGQSNSNGYNFVDDISYISTSWNGYREDKKDKFPNFPTNDLSNAQNHNQKRKDIDYLNQKRRGIWHKIVIHIDDS